MNEVPVDLNGKIVLVTGSPGFIGANLVLRLPREMTSGTIISLDNMNDYYDPALKEYRLRLIEDTAMSSPVEHIFIRGSIADKALVDRVFADYHPSVVVNLAAQAGVRYCLDHSDVYIESNVIGFYNILEVCRRNPVEHLVYAPRHLSMVETKKFRSAQTIIRIILFSCTQPPKRAMSF